MYVPDTKARYKYFEPNLQNNLNNFKNFKKIT